MKHFNYFCVLISFILLICQPVRICNLILTFIILFQECNVGGMIIKILKIFFLFFCFLSSITTAAHVQDRTGLDSCYIMQILTSHCNSRLYTLQFTRTETHTVQYIRMFLLVQHSGFIAYQ